MSVLASPDYPAVQEYLFSLKARGVNFGIDRMRVLAEALGHPERAFPTIHVAGTNGKGSVCAMLAAILRDAGWKAGLYTSPHLVRLGERVQVDGRPLTEEEIVAFVVELAPIAARVSAGAPDDHPSFFEFLTAMAFLQFARSRCDVGLIEVGLGGRLDATNVVQPELTVISSIGLDHCEYLGSTLEQIALEKAGIIKTSIPVVIGQMPVEAEAAIRRVAAQRGAPVFSVRENFGDDPQALPETRLPGDYQRRNAATAVLAARSLAPRWNLTLAAIQAGLSRVEWPGRWDERRVGDTRVILDASHNPEGARALDANLERLFLDSGRRPVIAIGVLGADRAAALLPVVARHAREIHLLVPKQARGCRHEVLEGLVPVSFSGAVHRSSVEELFPEPGVCRVGDTDETLVVTGSIYLVGEVLARIEPARGAGETHLQDF